MLVHIMRSYIHIVPLQGCGDYAALRVLCETTIIKSAEFFAYKILFDNLSSFAISFQLKRTFTACL